MLAHQVGFQHLPARDGQHVVGPLGVHQVHVEGVPAMELQQLQVGCRMVPDAHVEIAVGGVALHHGALDLLHHGSPEIGMEEVLVALLAGVDLHGHLAGEVDPQGVVELHHLLGGDLLREKNLRLHA